jgi:uncharacterized protein YdaU (DUF1376 family)
MAASKSSAKAPAFQFYPNDFLSDPNVMVMSLQERGAYITLICVCWTQGTLPDDKARLARLCGVPVHAFGRMWPALEPCFRKARTAGVLVHPRLERERDKQADFRRRQSDKGKASAANRKATGNEPRLKSGDGPVAVPVQPTPQPKGNSSIFSLQSSPSGAIAKNAIATRARGSTNPTDFAPDVTARVGEFIERYRTLYQKHRKGAHYLGNPQSDFREGALLCEAWDDARLDKLATVFLTTDHEFAEKGSRTLAQFRSMASWCDSRLRERGL